MYFIKYQNKYYLGTIEEFCDINAVIEHLPNLKHASVRIINHYRENYYIFKTYKNKKHDKTLYVNRGWFWTPTTPPKHIEKQLWLEYQGQEILKARIFAKKFQQALSNLNIEHEIRADYKSSKIKIHIIKRYPKLTLTNDFGQQHTIYGLYVKAVFTLTDDGYIKFYRIYGFRNLYRECELEARYCHPHCQKSSHFVSFCLGSYNRLYLNEKYKDITVEQLEDWLLNLQTYLEYEDLSNPYNTTSNLFGPLKKLKPTKTAIRYVLNNITKDDVEIINEGNKFIPKLKESVHRLAEGVNEKFKVNITAEGYETGGSPKKLKSYFEPYLSEVTFKGKKLRVKQIPDLDLFSGEKQISRSLITGVENQLKLKLNKKIYAKFQEIRPIKNISNTYTNNIPRTLQYY